MGPNALPIHATATPAAPTSAAAAQSLRIRVSGPTIAVNPK
jgi:hypothetical protein